LSAMPEVQSGNKLSMRRMVTEPFLVMAIIFLSLSPQSICQESDAVRYAKEADRALYERDYDLAIHDYNKLLRMEPSSAAAWNNLGAAWFAKGNFSQASAPFVRAARLQPANREYAFNAALVLVRQDKCDAAKVYLKRSLLSVQHRAAAQYLQGLCAFLSNNWLEAKDSLVSAEADGSETAETYYLLTIAARKSGDPNQAKKAFDLLRSKFPSSSLLHELIAEVLDQDDMGTDAQKELSLAITSSPRASGLHVKLGFMLWKVHRLPEAEKLFDQELAIDPHSYSAMYYLGDIAEHNNQLSQALKWYECALSEKPESSEAHLAAGRVLEREGRNNDALRELKASFPALEGDASAHYWMATVLKKLGMKEQANLELSKVQEIHEAERNAITTKLSNGER
jgi:tetratricopeptide (TPR) repeat protein